MCGLSVYTVIVIRSWVIQYSNSSKSERECVCHCPCAGLELCACTDHWCSGLCVLEESNARPRDTSDLAL